MADLYFFSPGFLRGRLERRIHEPGTYLRGSSPTPPPPGFLTGAPRPLHERVRARRQRRHFVGIKRTDQPRRDQHHQFRLFGAALIALEQVPDDRQLAQDRESRHRRSASRCRAGRRSQMSVRREARRRFLRAASSARERGSPAERDPVVEIERADLRLHLQTNHVAGDRRT